MNNILNCLIYMFILFLFSMILSFFHFLIFLIFLEFLNLLILMVLYNIYSFNLSFWMIIYYLILMVCEAVLGLMLLVIMVRLKGEDSLMGESMII